MTRERERNIHRERGKGIELVIRNREITSRTGEPEPIIDSV